MHSIKNYQAWQENGIKNGIYNKGENLSLETDPEMTELKRLIALKHKYAEMLKI